MRGGEVPGVEVKSAAGGLPDSLTETMSAFANLPGGGLVVLGLDERAGFTPVRLKDPAGLAAAVASRARQAFTPEIQVEVGVEQFEGRSVVVARVLEMPAAGKPCVVKRTGRSYLRFADGDYPMSRLEMDAFVASRSRPVFDERPVEGAGVDDLDEARVADYVATARSSDRRLGRLNDGDLLRRTGVVTSNGVPTVAGLLALGVYPQQHLPHCSVRAAIVPDGAQPTTRALDSATFTGPIPAMLEDAIAWVGRNSRTRVVAEPATGAVRDELDPPAVAVRELVANALVHRDLAEWASSRAIELRMSPGAFRLTNPGGLYGITTERLGVHPLTSARNRRLLEICKHVRTADGNVVEALASGIPATFDAVRRAGLPAPDFFDQGIAFTVVLRRTVDQAPAAAAPPVADVGPQARAVLAQLAEPKTVDEIADAFGISTNAARKRLAVLRAAGLVRIDGGPGRRTTYRRATQPGIH